VQTGEFLNWEDSIFTRLGNNIKVPDDGAYYMTSIKEKFPQDLWDKIDTQRYAEEQFKNCLNQALKHFNINGS